MWVVIRIPSILSGMPRIINTTAGALRRLVREFNTCQSCGSSPCVCATSPCDGCSMPKDACVCEPACEGCGEMPCACGGRRAGPGGGMREGLDRLTRLSLGTITEMSGGIPTPPGTVHHDPWDDPCDICGESSYDCNCADYCPKCNERHRICACPPCDTCGKQPYECTHWNSTDPT